MLYKGIEVHGTMRRDHIHYYLKHLEVASRYSWRFSNVMPKDVFGGGDAFTDWFAPEKIQIVLKMLTKILEEKNEPWYEVERIPQLRLSRAHEFTIRFGDGRMQNKDTQGRKKSTCSDCKEPWTCGDASNDSNDSPFPELDFLWTHPYTHVPIQPFLPRHRHFRRILVRDSVRGAFRQVFKNQFQSEIKTFLRNMLSTPIIEPLPFYPYLIK